MWPIGQYFNFYLFGVDWLTSGIQAIYLATLSCCQGEKIKALKISLQSTQKH